MSVLYFRLGFTAVLRTLFIRSNASSFSFFSRFDVASFKDSTGHFSQQWRRVGGMRLLDLSTEGFYFSDFSIYLLEQNILHINTVN